MRLQGSLLSRVRIREARLYAKPDPGESIDQLAERIEAQGREVLERHPDRVLYHRERFRASFRQWLLGVLVRLILGGRRAGPTAAGVLAFLGFVASVASGLPVAGGLVLLVGASLITTQGREDGVDNWVGNITDPIDAMGVSNFGALAAGTTTIGAAVFKVVNVLSSKTRTGQTVTTVGDFPKAEINGQQITTITLHNDGNDAFTGVQGGIDNQNATLDNIDLTFEADLVINSA